MLKTLLARLADFLAQPAAAMESEKLRFKVGDEVLCSAGRGGDFGGGTVVKLFYREPHFGDRAAPYQIRKHDGQLIFAPKDTNRFVRAVERPASKPDSGFVHGTSGY